ncbi:DUF554 family protein [Cyanobium sp. ATX-6F1]
MGLWAATSGTWINGLTVLLGSLLGARLGRSLGEGLRRHWRRWIGVVTLVLGLQMVQPLFHLRLGPLPALAPALLVLVLASALGAALGLDRRLARLLNGRPQASGPGDPELVGGAFVLFCVGPMTVVGCLRNGALGDPDLLLVKAALDGISAAVLATSAGVALAWVVLPLLVVQLSLSGVGALLAARLPDPATAPPVLFTAAVGGCWCWPWPSICSNCPIRASPRPCRRWSWRPWWGPRSHERPRSHQPGGAGGFCLGR